MFVHGVCAWADATVSSHLRDHQPRTDPPSTLPLCLHAVRPLFFCEALSSAILLLRDIYGLALSPAPLPISQFSLHFSISCPYYIWA